MAPPQRPRTVLPLLSASRSAYFCSGCPHNRSTVLPEGSMGGGGIGCHVMVTISDRPESAVTGVTQMGGEGAQWIGQAWFTDADHMFQNVGDGTFFHSAQPRRAGLHRGGGEHHLQDPAQRRRRDDRRAGRRGRAHRAAA
ncbi:hypothetical protein [Nocardioides convexus]|uniref:hypothetical protein n=1 Tax=Nocardioides convexus TaxID=2712224 RepID=UPI00241867A7|nr:hypothetical protein [Nocardioides convexus]